MFDKCLPKFETEQSTTIFLQKKPKHFATAITHKR